MKTLKKITFYLIIVVLTMFVLDGCLKAVNYEKWYNDNYMVLNDGNPNNDPVFNYPYKG